ncbi:MAG: response regulator, partial [Defluviitaleaceae bacterium]|nr:response regulator [Defluviitaleaceae bacterium]
MDEYERSEEDVENEISNMPVPYYGNVLVVDDMITNLYVMKSLLSAYGITVEIATSGFEAIKQIETGKIYNIIFMDHIMPELDGMQTVEVLRAMGYGGIIVALTANNDDGQRDMFMSRGFSEFMSKPVDIEDLDRCIARFIPVPSA